MTRIHAEVPEIVASTTETTERLFTVSMTQEQLYDAIFTWLRIKGVTLPSKNTKQYVIDISTGGYMVGDKEQHNVNIHHTIRS